MYIVLHGLASKLFGAAKIRLDIHLLEPPVNAPPCGKVTNMRTLVSRIVAPLIRWLTGEMSQNLIFPLNVIIIFLYISSFQDGLNDLSIPCGCLVVISTLLRRVSGVCQHNIYI